MGFICIFDPASPLPPTPYPNYHLLMLLWLLQLPVGKYQRAATLFMQHLGDVIHGSGPRGKTDVALCGEERLRSEFSGLKSYVRLNIPYILRCWDRKKGDVDCF